MNEEHGAPADATIFATGATVAAARKIMHTQNHRI